MRCSASVREVRNQHVPKYSEQFVDWLVEDGYTHCFFVGGGNIMHLLDAVRTRMVCVPVVHEVAAGIAAEYFNASCTDGRKALALVTAGPGLTNIVTAMAGAWQESRELLIVGGQVKTTDLGAPEIRQRGIQEIDGAGLVRSICKESVKLRAPMPRRQLNQLIALAASDRPGPVFIEMPLDVQAAPSLTSQPGHQQSLPVETVRAEPTQVEEVAELFRQAERPVLLIGGGLSFEAARHMLPRIVRLGSPVMTTWNGADRIPSEVPTNWGRPNTFGQRAANVLVQQADLVVAVGTRLGLQQTGFNWQEFAPLAHLVQVDIDPLELHKQHPRVSTVVHADAAEFLSAVLDLLPPLGDRIARWLEFGSEVRSLLPLIEPNPAADEFVPSYEFLAAVPELASPDALITPSSSGGTFTAAYQAMRLVGEQRMLSNKSLASMGYGLSGAIGMALANPTRQVILLEGDGGFAQNIQELGTVNAQRLNVKMFVLDNDGYASIRTTQRSYFGGAWIGCDSATGLGLPDWGQLAGAYGIPFRTLSGSDDWRGGLRAALAAAGPMLVRVCVDPAQTNYPKISSRVLPDGSMESNPLHLMHPPLSDDVASRVFRYFE